MQLNKQHKAQYFFITIFTTVYVFLRNLIPLLWTDSPRFTAFKYPLSIKQSDSCTFSYFSTIFNFGSSGYRPLDELITKLGICANYKLDNNIIPTFFSGLIFSLMIVSIYQLSKYFIKSAQFRVLAIVLFVTIPPVLAAGWNTFAGIQNLVILITSETLCCYLKLLIKFSRKNLIKLIVLAYLGTNYREYFFTVILVILLHQISLIHKKNNVKPPIIVATFALLINWYYPKLFLELINRKSITSRLEVGYFIDPKGNTETSLINFTEINFTPLVKMITIPLTLNIILVTVFAMLLAKTMITRTYLNININLMSFLGLWIFISFLPFLKVYTEDVHLMYPILPMILLGVSILEDSLNQLSFKLVTYFAYSLLGLSCLSNLYLSSQITIAMSNNLQKITNLIENQTSIKSNIISNALTLEEIRFRSKGYFLPKWTINQGIPFDPKKYSVGMYSDYVTFVEQNSNFGNKVFAGIFEHKFEVHKESFHRFPFTENLQLLAPSAEYCQNFDSKVIGHRSIAKPVNFNIKVADFDLTRNIFASLMSPNYFKIDFKNIYFPPDWVDDYGLYKQSGFFSKYEIDQIFYLEELFIVNKDSKFKMNIIEIDPKINTYGDFDKDFLSSTKYNNTFFESNSAKMEFRLMVPEDLNHFEGIVIANKYTPERTPREVTVEYFDGQKRGGVPSTEFVHNGNLEFDFYTKTGVTSYILTFSSKQSDILRISTIRDMNKAHIDCIVIP